MNMPPRPFLIPKRQLLAGFLSLRSSLLFLRLSFSFFFFSLSSILQHHASNIHSYLTVVLEMEPQLPGRLHEAEYCGRFPGDGTSYSYHCRPAAIVEASLSYFPALPMVPGGLSPPDGAAVAECCGWTVTGSI